MGGLLILGAAITPTLLWADLRNLYVWGRGALHDCVRDDWVR